MNAGALLQLAWWARAAFDYLSMGNYPYATGYILNDGEGVVELPPWPLREACSRLADPALQVRDICSNATHLCRNVLNSGWFQRSLNSTNICPQFYDNVRFESRKAWSSLRSV